ncbi:MAG: hypothetical protein K2H52_05820 [Lachnospiraceae bacterium]|nr:hypothetical protein [Lachnospiraceae bacterium]MDE6184217.1 hypothetical protein [Lachnospiraceae bacterium]
MKKLIQIYTGGVSGRNISIQQIQQKLDSLESNRADGIIVGWSLEQQIYKWLRTYTKDRGIELYLWFQVLAEFKSLGDFEDVRTLNGKTLRSAAFDGDEEFSFYCPSNPNTYKSLIEIFERHFSDIGFDGVLLDRIRFPSLAVDRNALFSCTCPFCMEKLAKRGVGRKDIEEAYRKIKQDAEKGAIFCIKEYKNGKYTFYSREVEEYLNVRTGLITDIVKSLADYFREKGMKVGLDLFAPFLSIFVGQDYTELSRSADFMKPMLYRHTYTPAGMQYELDGMAGEMAGSMKQIIGMEDGRLTDFMEKELEAVIKLSDCEIYAGMEVHTAKDLPLVRPQSVKEGTKLIEKMRCAGRVASWNILEASKENLLAFMEGVIV